MALTMDDDASYGDSQEDIPEEIVDYSRRRTYLAERFANAVCGCGGKVFGLALDEEVGAAVRTCAACETEHAIGDSDEYLDDADLDECACPCGNESFEITVGVALYRESEDMRWLYVGCRCPQCNLVAVYGDWKNEFPGCKAFLARV